MSSPTIREELHNYIDHVDEHVLRMIHAMLKEYTALHPLSPADETELDRRIKEYKTGQGKSYSVAEAKIELKKRLGKK